MRHKKYKIIPYISIILLFTALMCLCNFPLFAYSMNRNSYKVIKAEVVDRGFDGLTSLVPKITVTYTFNGEDYEESFLDYNKWIFRHQKIPDNFNVFVNNKSPSNLLYIRSFCDSYINLGFGLINLICSIIIVVNVGRKFNQNGKEKYIRKARKEAKRRYKQHEKGRTQERKYEESSGGAEIGGDQAKEDLEGATEREETTEASS